MWKPTGEDRYRPVSWEQAFERVAVALRALASPDEAIFYTSGRTSNEAAFLYQLFVREYGTNNLPDCSDLCHESSGAGLSEAIGVGKGTVSLDDFEHADLILLLGQNPGSNHPRMFTTLLECQAPGLQGGERQSPARTLAGALRPSAGSAGAPERPANLGSLPAGARRRRRGAAEGHPEGAARARGAAPRTRPRLGLPAPACRRASPPGATRSAPFRSRSSSAPAGSRVRRCGAPRRSTPRPRT